MIVAARIENFQAHKDTELEFVPGVNAITGESCTGKSSAMRALRWNLSNNPRGDAFRTHHIKPKDMTRVSVEFSEETYVARERNEARVNQYIVVDDIYGDHEETYKAMSTAVPSEVTCITRMGEANIQPQKQHWFMLGDSPGNVAREFNKVANLDTMTAAQKEVNTRVKWTKSRVDHLEEDIEKLEEKIKSYDFVDTAEAELIPFEEMDAKIDSKVAEYNALESAVEEYKYSKIKLVEFDDLPEIKEALSHLEKIHTRLDAVSAEFTALEEAVISREESKENFDEYAYIDDAEKMLSELSELAVNIDTLSKQRRKLTNEVAENHSAQYSLIDVDSEVQSIEDNLAKFKSCPLCGGAL